MRYTVRDGRGSSFPPPRAYEVLVERGVVRIRLATNLDVSADRGRRGVEQPEADGAVRPALVIRGEPPIP